MKNIQIPMSIRRSAVMLAAIAVSLIIQAAIPEMSAADSDPRPNRAGLKIKISSPGLYRIFGTDVNSAGIDMGTIDPATFRMFHRDTEIPITISADQGFFETTDFIEFYAQGASNRYTATDVYWLYWNGVTGNQMGWVGHVPDNSEPLITYFTQRATIEENHVMWSDTPGAPESDYWFKEKLIAPQSTTWAFDLPAPVIGSLEAAVTVFFQGSTDTGHHTTVSLNGQPISDEIWFGDIAKGQTSDIPGGLLNYPTNTLSIKSSNDISTSGDVVYLNKLTVVFQCALKAVNNRLIFQLNQENATRAKISGFTTENIRMFDITAPDAVTKMTGIAIENDGDGHSVTFRHTGGEKTYLALTADAVDRVTQIEYIPPHDLKSGSNQADYIVITSDALMPGLERLVELRRRQGLTVKAVAVEDLYDVFSYGFFNPAAIKHFLEYTLTNWASPAPQYVLLAGDSNLDYRDYYGTGKQNIVPVYLGDTYELGLTPSDNWYVSFDTASLLPEMYIGRIPGEDLQTVSEIANKLIWYETSESYAPAQALFVADDEDPAFESLNDGLADLLPLSFSANKVYSRYFDNLENATAKILSFINQGMLITNFVGHGDVIRWGAEPDGGGDFIISPEDIDALSNQDRLTFVTALNCLNGYFSQPFEYCLAEQWVRTPETGAIACFAPSGLSHQWEHELLGAIIFDKIFNEKENRIGAIVTDAKIDAYFSGATEKVLVSLNLIGDPATTLAVYRNPAEMVTAYTIKASGGAGGEISPSGNIPAFENAREAFTITPNTGYRISDVVVDGISQGAIGQYTFDNISAGHVIYAEFEYDSHTGGSSGGGGGCFIASMINP